MTVEGPLRLGLELDGAGEPISGRLRREDGSACEFVGWLELTRALDDARSEVVEDTGGGRHEGEG